MDDETGYQYDGRGSITAVQRYGNTGALMDNLTYTYATGTNRLRHIGDAVAAGTFSTDIDNQVSDNYAYDGNGSLQKDLQRDVAFVVNDIHNLPVSVGKASTGQELKYFYDTEGKRIRKDAGSTEYYVNGLTGETEAVVKSDASGATHSMLGRDNLGQVKRSGTTFARYYYLKDHLGTIKMTVDASCNTTGYDDYYPFGQQMDGRSYTSSADARYKYTSKERDAESGYDYFGARYYDARIGRWMGVDPLAAKYAEWTPYHFVFDNPVRFVDPDGRDTLGVMFTNDRSEAGLALLLVDGNVRLAFPVLGQGKNRGQETTFGDTPTGEATINRIVDLDPNGEYMNEDGTPVDPSLQTLSPIDVAAYGRFFIPLDPQAGHLSTSGRTGIGIHGGGTSLGNDALAPRQELVYTLGCIRGANSDVASLVQGIRDASTNSRPFRVNVTESGLAVPISRMAPLPLRLR